MTSLSHKLHRKFAMGKFWLLQKHIHNYSFIHINKCGGTSVEKLLSIPKVHDTAGQRIKILGRNRWDERYTFTIIRHPYSKVVSHYNYRIKKNQTELATKKINLNEWIKMSYGDQDAKFFDKPLMFAPCFDWVTFENKVVVKKIIKLEEIDTTWGEVCLNLGIPERPLSKRNKTHNSTIEMAIQNMDKEAISIINHRFRNDFKYFHYDPIDL